MPTGLLVSNSAHKLFNTSKAQTFQLKGKRRKTHIWPEGFRFLLILTHHNKNRSSGRISSTSPGGKTDFFFKNSLFLTSDDGSVIASADQKHTMPCWCWLLWMNWWLIGSILRTPTLDMYFCVISCTWGLEALIGWNVKLRGEAWVLLLDRLWLRLLVLNKSQMNKRRKGASFFLIEWFQLSQDLISLNKEMIKCNLC